MAEIDVEEFGRWLEQADRAIDSARLLADGGRHDWACFLAEQGAQLAVKGLLHGIGHEAWGHDLTVLTARAATALGATWARPMRDEAARLARHYIPARYPDAHPSGAPGAHYEPSDSEQALADASALREAVVAAWDLLTGDEP
jgi:HEPN domain-containing protein